MIAAVYRFENDMIAVFDEHGQQMPDLQGPYTPALLESICNASCGLTAWHGFHGPRANWKQYRERNASASEHTP